jgi:hypothetical protein
MQLPQKYIFFTRIPCRTKAYTCRCPRYIFQSIRLTVEHIEKLILLFDNFEVINGGRNYASNFAWEQILRNLSMRKIDEHVDKHGVIIPQSENSWIKGFTGGSDEHAGIFIAKTSPNGVLADANMTFSWKLFGSEKVLLVEDIMIFSRSRLQYIKLRTIFSKTTSNNKFAEKV